MRIDTECNLNSGYQTLEPGHWKTVIPMSNVPVSQIAQSRVGERIALQYADVRLQDGHLLDTFITHTQLGKLMHMSNFCTEQLR